MSEPNERPEDIDKRFQAYRQSAVYLSATIIALTLAVAASWKDVLPEILQNHPVWRALWRAVISGIVLVLIAFAVGVQYLVFRGSLLHARMTVEPQRQGQEDLWKKGNEAFGCADRAATALVWLFVAALVVLFFFVNFGSAWK